MLPPFLESAPTLPQDDPEPAKRAEALAAKREEYTYSYDLLAPAALAADVPKESRDGLEWYAGVAEGFVGIAVNSHKVDDDLSLAEEVAGDLRAVAEVIQAAEAHGVKGIFAELNELIMNGVTEGRPENFEAYAGLFQQWPVPRVAAVYDDDLTFARMRVAGPNPVWIERVTELPDHFPVPEAHFVAAMGDGDSLAAAAAQGRLYLADYRALDGVECGTFQSGAQKYLAAPLALFAVPEANQADRRLRPVAIQCQQTPGPDNPVFGPKDGVAWKMAKTAVQTADGNCHQAVAHLGWTHLVVEPFVVAARRHLSDHHPLMVLLLPHFEGTLPINESAATNLIAPGGGVDYVMSPNIETSRKIAAGAVAGWDFDGKMLHADLKARGVDDADALPVYPYRDDALLVREALHAWVGGYLRLYYPGGDGDVAADAELQAWCAEVGSQTGGRIKGFGTGGGIPSLAYLIEAITHLIFTGSAQHAAVNFPQWELMSYAPNLPLANFRAAPTSTAVTEADYLDMLPPMDTALMQTSLARLLGTFYYTQLGQYPRQKLFFDYFADGRVRPKLRAFQAALANVEATIEDRNHDRTPYRFLLPSKIPQSINI